MNPKLANAIAAGKALWFERFDEQRQREIEIRLEEYLCGDWIYNAIRDEVAAGRDRLHLHDKRFIEDRARAQIACDAVNLIPGLFAYVGFAHLNVHNIEETTYFVVVSWS